MRFIISLWIAIVVCVSAFGYEYGPVRDAIAAKKWEPITIDDTTTILHHAHAMIPIVATNIMKMCSDMGGTNLFVVPSDGVEQAWLKGDGSLSEYAEINMSLFPSFSKEDIFKTEKPYPMFCKNGNKQVFKLTRRINPYKDSTGVTWYNALYTFTTPPLYPHG